MTDAPQLSRRALSTPPSPIRKLAALAQAAKQRGVSIYHLNIGQPDIRTPAEYWQGIDSYPRDVLAYEQSEGSTALRQAFADYLDNSLAVALSSSDILVTTGASEALVMLFMACADPGSEVIIFDPTYANYIGFAAVAGVTLVPVPGQFQHNYALPSRDAVLSHITPKTRAILLCNPNNPTGTVYSRKDLEMLLEIAESRRLFLIVDETYREFVYDGAAPLSVLQLAPADPRVVVVDSLSKRFSLCGARLGFVVSSNRALHAALLNIAQARLAAPSMEQHASARMINSISPQFISQVRQEYQERRDTLVAALRAIPGVEVPTPGGAFYLLAKLPVEDAEAFARFLLEQFNSRGESVFIAPAQGFFMEAGRGRSKVRLAYVLERDKLRRAVEIIGLALHVFNKT